MSQSPLRLSRALQKKVDFARMQTVVAPDSAHNVLSCLDLTSLSGNETLGDISELCRKSKFYELASVCVLPQYVRQASTELKGSGVKVATVVNFPYGNKRTGSDQVATPNTVPRDIWTALKDGAGQIDIVQPYTENPGAANDFMRAARMVIPPTVTMKVILESAAFNEVSALYDAALIAVTSGADCLKTSTGKHPHGGATLEAAAVMLDAIAHSRKTTGIKITGGISSLEDCLTYMALKKIFSANAISPSNFRIGSSRLLDVLASEGHIPEYHPR